MKLWQSIKGLALATLALNVACATPPGGPPKPKAPPVTAEEFAAESEREMAWYDCLARMRDADPFCGNRGLLCRMANSDRRARHDDICKRFIETR